MITKVLLRKVFCKIPFVLRFYSWKSILSPSATIVRDENLFCFKLLTVTVTSLDGIET